MPRTIDGTERVMIATDVLAQLTRIQQAVEAVQFSDTDAMDDGDLSWLHGRVTTLSRDVQERPAWNAARAATAVMKAADKAAARKQRQEAREDGAD
jgi:hypothetical protein